MTTHKEALTLALKALEDLNGMAQFFPDELYSDHPDVMKAAQAITAIKEALAQPEQEPVAIYQYKMGDGSWIDQEKHSYDYNKRYAPNATVRVVYTTPPQRTWVGLTDEEFVYFCSYVQSNVLLEIESKLKEKNA